MSKVFSFCLSLLLLSSCLDVIEFELPQDRKVLVIDAQFDADSTFHSVFISLSKSFDNLESQESLGAPGARVVLKENNNQEFEFQDNGGGVYTLGPLNLKEDFGYELIINYNQNVYISDVEFVRKSIPIKDITFDYEEEIVNNTAGNIISRNFIRIKVSSSIEEDQFVRYRVQGTYQFNERGSPSNLNPLICFVPENIDANNNIIASGENQNDGELFNLPVIERSVDYKFRHNYCFTIFQQSISKKAYQFWDIVKDEFERTGDIFETPPAELKGNISSDTDSEVIGLFSIINSSTAQILIGPEDVGFPPARCTFRDEFESCRNCLVIPQSTLLKPSCFE